MSGTSAAYEKSWTHPPDPDREFPEGPWSTEPDKVYWVDPDTGLDCLIVRGPMGALCGYVGVPPGHPFHGLDADNEKVDVTAHGGLNFADSCHEDERGEGYGICHVPLPGRPADVWWFGFDCGHAWDLIPGLLRGPVGELAAELMEHCTYRDITYVTAEVAGLARELAGLPGNEKAPPTHEG